MIGVHELLFVTPYWHNAQIPYTHSGGIQEWARWASRPPLESLGEILEERWTGGKGREREKEEDSEKRGKEKNLFVVYQNGNF